MEIEVDLELEVRFKPTDECLINVLLRLASGGGINFRSDRLEELHLYGPGKEPWKLFAGDQQIHAFHNVGDPEKKVREKYIISGISRISGKTNISRTAGAGTWVDKSTAKEIKIGDVVMGHQRILNYEYCGGDGDAAGKDYYYLNEFQLSAQALQRLNIQRFDRVACRVMKDTSKALSAGQEEED